MLDIIIVSTSETGTNYHKSLNPLAKVIQPQQGTLETMKLAALTARTKYFYLVDDMLSMQNTMFDYSFRPELTDEPKNYYFPAVSPTNVKQSYPHLGVKCLHRDSYKYMDPGHLNRFTVHWSTFDIMDEMLKIVPHNEMIPVICGSLIQQPSIAFISYDEPNADENFERLKARFPVTRVHGVRGIANAHKQAASMGSTRFFYIVDGDSEVLETFDFSFYPTDGKPSIHIWHARNPVNDLEYGYGGIKLFDNRLLTPTIQQEIDMTTSLCDNIQVIPEVASITQFNSDPYISWRSGFRECVKLASGVIPRSVEDETRYRLDMWCSKGEDRLHGSYTILGARDGRAYGEQYKNEPEALNCINNFAWLKNRFYHTTGTLML